MKTEKSITLKPGREKSVLLHHPWIFSGSIASVNGDPGSGDTVLVQTSRNEPLGWAAYSPLSSIRARMWNWDASEQIDRDFFRRKLVSAIERRKAIIPADETNAMRLVHAESDGIPGLIVDQYADNLVFQLLTAGAETWRDHLIGLTQEFTGCSASVERSDVDIRHLEGLSLRSEVINGITNLDQVEIIENKMKFKVDLVKGQKTGFYIDQRRNRQRVRELAADRKVLNCFCYTGGFTVYALAGGAAEVTSIDSSGEALELGRQNAELNGFKEADEWWIEGDVFQYLRLLRDRARQFDMVILDPPKFAPTAAQAERAARGYKDINLLAMKLLKPGGLLVTFSCSGGISADLFQKIVAGAALDAGVEARIIERLSQGPDHPVALNFPEGAYLKGLICQIN